LGLKKGDSNGERVADVEGKAIRTKRKSDSNGMTKTVQRRIVKAELKMTVRTA